MSGHRLPTSTPAARGVDAAGVVAFLDDMESARDVELHSLMVLRHGHVVAQGWWAPYSADRHLAAMASGHTRDTWGEVAAADPADPVRGFLRLPPDREPGTVFAYNQPATYTLAAILQRRTGQRLVDYLRPRLLDPLGIGEVTWQQHPAGRDLGFTGLHATTDAVARLGQLHLQGGWWDGRQLLPQEWVAEATRAHVHSSDRDTVDWRQGYGFQFWMSLHGYRGDGAYGQFCLVLPEADAVVAITGQSPDMQRVLDGVWDHLLPAFGAAPTDGASDAALQDRLDRLALPPLQVEASAPGDPSAWDGTTFTPERGVSADQPSLVQMTVAGDQDGWLVTLGERGSDVAVRLGTDGWLTSDVASRFPVPTSVSGGWTDARTLRLAVVFLETPHLLDLTCRLPERTFHARWITAPLGGSLLRDLRSPRPEDQP